MHLICRPCKTCNRPCNAPDRDLPDPWPQTCEVCGKCIHDEYKECDITNRKLHRDCAECVACGLRGPITRKVGKRNATHGLRRHVVPGSKPKQHAYYHDPCFKSKKPPKASKAK
jgi:hypothetical protein